MYSNIDGSIEYRKSAVLGITLLILHFALAPLSARAITTTGGLLALTALFVGWGGIRLLPRKIYFLFAGFLLYVGTALLSLINNENWQQAGYLFEKYHPFLFAIPILGWFALFREQLERALVIGLSGASVALTAIAAYEKAVLQVERAGYLTGLDPIVFGHIASIAALVLMGYGILSSYPRWLRVMMFVLALGALYAVTASGTRMAVLAFISGVVALFFLWIFRVRASRRQLVVAIAVVSGVALLLGLVFLQSEFWRNHWLRMIEEPVRVLSGETAYSSTGARFSMWLGGWKIGLENFWLGTGLGDVRSDLAGLMASGEVPAIGPPTGRLHNIFIDAFSHTGVIGVIAMLLAIFIFPFYYFSKNLEVVGQEVQRRTASIIGVALLTNVAVFGLANSWHYLRSLHFFLPLLLALIVISTASDKRSPSFRD